MKFIFGLMLFVLAVSSYSLRENASRALNRKAVIQQKSPGDPKLVGQQPKKKVKPGVVGQIFDYFLAEASPPETNISEDAKATKAILTANLNKPLHEYVFATAPFGQPHADYSGRKQRADHKEAEKIPIQPKWSEGPTTTDGSVLKHRQTFKFDG
eukprot:Platyproteum_vivax@DN6306_c0_g1_i1.p1